MVHAKVVSNLGQQRSQSVARHVDLSDDFSGRIVGVFLPIDLQVVVLWIDAHLMGVRPVELAVGGEIKIRITAGSPPLFLVGGIKQRRPGPTTGTFVLCWDWG